MPFNQMTNELCFRVLALAAFIVMRVIRSRTQSRSGRDTTTRALSPFSDDGHNRVDRVILFAVGILMSLSIVIYSLLPSWIRWAQASLPDWLRWVGVGVCVSSLLLLAWSDHHLGPNFSHTLRIRNQHYIVESGPYRWVRHPIYTSGLLFFVGVFLVSSNFLVAFCWSGLILLYTRRIPKEEAMMIGAFGDDYRAYMKRTGRLLPKLVGTANRERTSQ